MFRKFIEMVQMTETHEMDCDEVFTVLDIYAEAVVRGEDTSEMVTLVKQHLHICSCCTDEYEALMRILETEEL